MATVGGIPFCLCIRLSHNRPEQILSRAGGLTAPIGQGGGCPGTCGTPSTAVPCDDESWRKSVEVAKCTWIIGSHTSKPKRRCARGSRWRLRQSLVNHARVDPRHFNSRACFRASLAGSATGAHGHTMNRPARDKGIEGKRGGNNHKNTHLL